MSVTEREQFVDSNILVYAFDISAGWKRERAVELLGALWESESGHLSIQVLQEFYVNITRISPARYRPEAAIELVSEYTSWQIHSPVPGDLLRAAAIQTRYQISFWDAMIINSAAALNCETLWTEDLNHGQTYDGVRVVNPFLDNSD